MGKSKTHEEFVSQVEEVRGKGYEILSRYIGINDPITVRHDKCGEKYDIRPTNLLRSVECMYCYWRSKATKHEEFINIMRENREDIKVLGEYKNNRTKLLFKHSCGFEWEAIPDNVIRGTSCPECRINNKRSNHSEFVNKVDKLVGEEYVVIGRYTESKLPIKMRHTKCGHEWTTTPNRFLRGRRCPECKSSHGEVAVGKTLGELGIKYVREKSIGGRLKADFYIKEYRAIIEFDGEQHYRPIEVWGGEDELKNIQRRDKIKDLYCGYMGVKLLRIPYWELDNIPEIVTEFINELESKRGRRTT